MTAASLGVTMSYVRNLQETKSFEVSSTKSRVDHLSLPNHLASILFVDFETMFWLVYYWDWEHAQANPSREWWDNDCQEISALDNAAAYLKTRFSVVSTFVSVVYQSSGLWSFHKELSRHLFRVYQCFCLYLMNNDIKRYKTQSTQSLAYIIL